jgi:proteasome inhibitor subunit 1 (PI31)
VKLDLKADYAIIKGARLLRSLQREEDRCQTLKHKPSSTRVYSHTITTTTMSSLLDPSALLEQLPKLLPDTSGSIQSPQDALAILSHTLLTRLSFRLTSLSDASTAQVESFPNNVLPSSWNFSGPSNYTFRYAHDQSSLRFLLKVVSLGSRILIHATALESNRTESYEVEVERFTSRSYWPWQKDTKHSEPLINGFVSSTRVADFVFGFQAKIVQKLIPGLRKEGYEEVTDTDQGSTSAAASSSSSSQRAQRQPPPDSDDFNRPSLQQPPFRNPLIIGDRDLDPLGGRGNFGPPPLFGGGGPLGRFPGGDDGGGMFVGPNHPIFRDRFPPQGGIGGGPVPPGARFDPVGPFGQGPLRPGAGRGRPPGGMGDPDWDEMPPPRSNVSLPR